MFFPIPAFRSFRQWMDTSSAFVRAWVRSPRSVGMVCPSGMPLARSMAAFAPRKGDGLVVELGAGTGTVTRQLLDAGIAPRRLVVVEQSPVMVSTGEAINLAEAGNLAQEHERLVSRRVTRKRAEKNLARDLT